MKTDKKTMTKNEKLDILRVWLHDHKITYNEEYNLDGVEVRLWIPLYRIAVVTEEDDADRVYPKITQNQSRAFFVRNTDSEDFLKAKMKNCIRDIRLTRAIRYCWKHFDQKQKRKYDGIFPMNFGRFKKEFVYCLAKCQDNIDDVVMFYFPNLEKGEWL